MEVLFAGLESRVSESAVTEFVNEPEAVAVTVSVMLVELPAVKVPTGQMRAPETFEPREAETKLTLAGKVSVTITPLASVEPRFATVIVKVMFWSMIGGSGSEFWVTAKSTPGVQQAKPSAMLTESMYQPVPP